MTETVRVGRGLWRPSLQVEDMWGRFAALLTLCPDDAVLSGLTAARLHEMWLPRLRDGRMETIVHPSQPAVQRGRNRRPEILARRQVLADEDITTLRGLPVTTLACTWVHVASRLSMADLIAAGDSVLRGGTTLDDLHIQVGRAKHCRGIVRARAALPLLDKRSRSRPESHLRYAIVGAGLPAPAVNQAIHDGNGGWIAEPDLHYDDVRLALEYQGADHAEVDRMQRDLTRAFNVTFEDWLVVGFGPAEVFRHPDQVASLVRKLRRDRGDGAFRRQLAS